MPLVELGLAALYIWTIVESVRYEVYFSLPFLLLFLVGFLYVGLMSMLQSFVQLRRRITA